MNTGPHAPRTDPAADLVGTLRQRGLTLATAESLTAGMLSSRVADVPGASQVLLGGVVSYATAVKIQVLGVPRSLVEEHGVVSAACAQAMAAGVVRLTGAGLGIATTGVAGPDPQDGHPVGTVHLGLAAGPRVWSRELSLTGDRAQIRAGTVRAALEWVLEHLDT